MPTLTNSTLSPFQSCAVLSPHVNKPKGTGMSQPPPASLHGLSAAVCGEGSYNSGEENLQLNRNMTFPQIKRHSIQGRKETKFKMTAIHYTTQKLETERMQPLQTQTEAGSFKDIPRHSKVSLNML